MNHRDDKSEMKEYIGELIVKAVQSGKQETSGLVADIKNDLKEIKLQVQTTNGRVGRLENWRWLITGGLAVISIMVIPLLIYIYNHTL